MIVTGKAPNPTKMVSLRIPTTSMRPCALLRRARLATTANSQNISFLPAITSTSTRESSKTINSLSLLIESLKTRAMPESQTWVQNYSQKLMPNMCRALA